MSETIDAAKVRNAFERWSKLEDDRQATSDELKELFATAKSAGLNRKAMRAAFYRKRNFSPAIEKAEAEVERYFAALTQACEADAAEPTPETVPSILVTSPPKAAAKRGRSLMKQMEAAKDAALKAMTPEERVADRAAGDPIVIAARQAARRKAHGLPPLAEMDVATDSVTTTPMLVHVRNSSFTLSLPCSPTSTNPCWSASPPLSISRSFENRVACEGSVMPDKKWFRDIVTLFEALREALRDAEADERHLIAIDELEAAVFSDPEPDAEAAKGKAQMLAGWAKVIADHLAADAAEKALA